VTCATAACRKATTVPLCGPCFARWARGLPADSPESVCAIPDCPGKHWALGYCRAHHARLTRGSDLSVPLHPKKVRGATYHPRTGCEPMRLVKRSEQAETLSVIWESGGTVQTSAWAYEDRQAEQLGDPEMWQAVADAALDRAWLDLTSGAYEQRLAGRLAALRPAKPKTVQSPLVASVRPL
jgi:hypothetical protein